jgi:hypothetical protein
MQQHFFLLKVPCEAAGTSLPSKQWRIQVGGMEAEGP